MTINGEEKWVPLLEYARYKQISISSVRRYIKANRVKYKFEDGRYHILVKNYFGQDENTSKEEIIEALKMELKKVKEENQELRMLVQLYEKDLIDQDDQTFFESHLVN